MKDATPRQQLVAFMSKFTPEVQSVAKKALAKMRKRAPGAMELVYDNYNALAIGFAPTDRASDVVFSIALYPRWVSLFFLNGAKLRDPSRILKGSGTRVRHIVLRNPEDLDSPEVAALIEQAKKIAATPFPSSARGRMIIKSVSARQRPRKHP
jgi:hypothetical protein